MSAPFAPGGAVITIDIYARVSLDADLTFKSTEDQVLDCRDRIEDAGFVVGEVFIDNSKSAWNPKVKRPEWERLMAKIEAGLCAGLIVFDLARFSRKPIDGERLITAAAAGMIVLDSENGYDLTTANGRKTFRDHMTAAAYESDRTSTRTKRGKRRKAAKGLTNHSVRPFGFEQDGYTLRAGEVETIRFMYRWVVSDRKSIKSLCATLNAEGIVTSRGGAWDHTNVRAMLLRARNVGLIESHGQIVGTLKDAELGTVIDQATYDDGVALLASRRRGRPSCDTYLGSGVLVCGRCGCSLYGAPVGGHYETGERRRRYLCKSTNPRGCNGTSIDWRPTDQLIEAMVLNLLTGQRVETVRRQVADEHAEARRALTAQIEEADQTAEAMAERLGLGQIKYPAYEAFMGRHEPRVLALRSELAELPAPPATDESFAELTGTELLARWQDPETTPEVRRRLIKRALNGQVIVVSPATVGGRFDPERLTVADRPAYQPRVREVA